jgi:predicted nucleic acid-binding protein
LLIVDTGVLVAAADTDDPFHEACATLLVGEPGPLVTTPLVIAEVAYLLDRQLGPHAEASVYESIIDGELIVETLAINDWARVRELVVQYASLRLGGTDASLVTVAERHRERRIATLNTRDFRVVVPRHIDHFIILPSR